jgi:hypothetical protein
MGSKLQEDLSLYHSKRRNESATTWKWQGDTPPLEPSKGQIQKLPQLTHPVAPQPLCWAQACDGVKLRTTLSERAACVPHFWSPSLPLVPASD